MTFMSSYIAKRKTPLFEYTCCIYIYIFTVQAAGMTSRGMLLAGTCMVGVFKLLGEVLAALLIER